MGIAQLIEQSPTLKRLGVLDGRNHMQILEGWNQAVGEAVARNTQPLKFQDGKLTVAVSSAAWTHNLTLMKPQLLEALAQAFGPNKITDIQWKTSDFDMKKFKAGS